MQGHLHNTIELVDDVSIRSNESSAQTSTEVYAMPATQGQVRFWSLDQMNPGNPALNMPLMWQCNGPLNAEAMKLAFTECVRRHESLRTTFSVVEGRVSQIIHPAMAMPIPMDDLTALSGEEQRLEADRITRVHAAFRFDLENGPLLVLRLLKLGQQQHLLLVTMHHVICDGISNGILMRDMEVFYESLLQHTEPRLPELPIQFADYAVWHEEWRASEDHAASMQFWRDNLGKDFNPIRLPHDADAVSLLPAHRKDSTGDIETLLVPHDLTARAHAFCAREGVTLNVLLFSIFNALLARLTGQKDLTIGSPCANRNEDTEELIGMFMNIQVLRIRLEERSTFRDLLRQVNAWTLAAVDNQSLPFEDLVHDPFFADRGSLEIPIFFLYQKSFMLTRRIESAAGSLQIVPLRSESPGAIFELMFAVVDRDEEGPRLQLEYNPRCFKPSTIQNYLRLYVQLLESAISSPDAAIDDLELLSARSREMIVSQWNNTATDLGAFESVQASFLRRAAAAPEAIAVECNGVEWTNRKLADRAREIAVHLLNEGLQTGDLVGICVGRSPEMLASLLGTLMAGGAYVPLDPRHPRERMEMVLADAQPSVILCDRDLDVMTNAKMFRVDDLPSKQKYVALPEAPAPEALAYVIYTSGSTGKPKGVAIEQGALVNLLRSMERTPGLSSNDTLVAVTTLGFDIAALELLLPLLTGARLVIATDEEAYNPALLLNLLKDSQATVLQATPGLWRALMDAGWTRKMPLRVLCGGEAMSRDLADKLLERSDEVWNVYGPTETTIWSSATRIAAGVAPPRVGPPIANTQFYVLDKHKQPVPIGVDGELYIGGTGLARGYWNKSDLTAEKFIPNPFAPGRIYQTGDLARWHDDGTVQLLGRADFQVKVRGYRIELGEIEAALMKHPLIRETVVLQHVLADEPGRAGVTRLVAYVDAGEHGNAANAPALIAELERLLGRMMPDYMMPNAIVAVESMPRNTNGKIDRSALPDVFAGAGDDGLRSHQAEELDFVAPRDIIERQLAEMWQTTLGIPRISVRANFFSLGVGSLAALRLVTRMNRIYATDLGLASLISASTIESIADLVRNRISSKTTSTLVPLKADGDEPALFIVHGVGGNVINFYALAMRIDPCQPVYGVQSQALLAGQPALLRLEDMAAYYVSEIRKLQPHGPYRLLGYSFGGAVVLEMAHQLRAAGEPVAPLGMLDARAKHFEDARRSELSTQDKINKRMRRFHGNTVSLTWGKRLAYFYDKAKTRAIRFSCKLAATLNFKHVPSFMKSAYDINHVALNRYKPRPYDGKMILFRATEQEYAGGPRDLGWSEIFTQGVEIHEIDGDHERIFLEPSIEILAAALHAAVQRA
jgi:amino acid adenylation domain-containing protein